MYVDAQEGKDETSCGQSPSRACKNLQHAVNRVRDSGTIHLMTDLTLEESVSISKNVFITSKGQQPVLVAWSKEIKKERNKRANNENNRKRKNGKKTRKNKTKNNRKNTEKNQKTKKGKNKDRDEKSVPINYYAFQVTRNKALGISNVHFTRTGLLRMETDSKVNLTNIRVFKSPSLLIEIQFSFTSKFRLSIVNSSFENTGCIIKRKTEMNLKHEDAPKGYGHHSVVNITSSSFTQTKGIHLEFVKHVSIRTSIFRNHDVRMRGVSVIYLQKVGWFTLKDSTFQAARPMSRDPNHKKTSNGGFVSMLLSERLYIDRCVFNEGHVTGAGGALFVKGIDKGKISGSVFTNCSSGFKKNGMGVNGGGRGGAVVVMNVKEKVELVRCKFIGNKAKYGGAVYGNEQLKFRRIGWEVQKNYFLTKLHVIGCLFVDNLCRGVGQAIYCNDKLSVFNTTVLGKNAEMAVHVHAGGDRVVLQGLKVGLSKNHCTRCLI